MKLRIMQNNSIRIFSEGFSRLSAFTAMLNSKIPVIAFSGGKDSSLLLLFYQYLTANGLSPEPVLYHLDHSIRQNAEQEGKIHEFMKQSGFPFVFKKKTL